MYFNCKKTKHKFKEIKKHLRQCKYHKLKEIVCFFSYNILISFITVKNRMIGKQQILSIMVMMMIEITRTGEMEHLGHGINQTHFQLQVLNLIILSVSQGSFYLLKLLNILNFRNLQLAKMYIFYKIWYWLYPKENLLLLSVYYFYYFVRG